VAIAVALLTVCCGRGDVPQDVSKHFGHVALLKTKSLATPSANAEAMGSVEDVDLMMVSLIMVCDLGHAAKPFEMHERWTDLVTEEFFRCVLRCKECVRHRGRHRV